LRNALQFKALHPLFGPHLSAGRLTPTRPMDGLKEDQDSVTMYFIVATGVATLQGNLSTKIEAQPIPDFIKYRNEGGIISRNWEGSDEGNREEGNKFA